jgi:hypothetical protein
MDCLVTEKILIEIDRPCEIITQEKGVMEIPMAA